ncbi:MAG: S8 family peptidase, partial [candidate division KSB1 bacterium]|nr:S8 family peptidase [candidate division KSB1 bacterium]
PGGHSFSRATGEPYTSKDTDEGTIWINNASYGPDPNNGDNECYIYVADKFESKPPASGTWKITITGINLPSGGTFDIWAAYNTLTSDPYEIIFTNNFVNEVLVASPGTATKPITVAAYVTKNSWICPTGQTSNWPYNQVIGDIAWYSSPGPRRDGVLKPEITAPGSNIAAARSKDWITSVSSLADDGVHAVKHGTSLAAPHVTGAVALLLEQNPSLSNDEVKSILTRTATSDAFTGTVPNPIWGYGKLDIYAAMGGTKSTRLVSGTGTNIFPFPNGNVMIDFTNHTGNDEVTVKMFTSPPPNAQWKVLSRYYNLTTTLQHFEANLTFPYAQEEFDQAGIEDGETSLCLWRSNNGGQSWEAVSSTVDPVNNTITATGVTSFSLWAMGEQAVVPIELSSFTASVEGKDAILMWETLSETNNLGFEIQRRQEITEFVKIGFISGAGTSSEPHTYKFVDAGLADGTYSYRLKQIDTDGKITFSPVVSVTVATAKGARLYANYPNPFNPATIIQYDLTLGSPVELRVLNVSGQEVMRLVNEWQTAGHYAVRFDAGSLASGVYFCHLSAGRFSAIQKMLYIK